MRDPGQPSLPNPATLPRLFVPHALAAGQTVAASTAQAHQLGAVLRRGVGDGVRLFNGRDGEWLARLAHLRRGEASFLPESLLRSQAMPSGPVLFFAVLKRDATDLVVQKATELGARLIVPLQTDRSVAGRINDARLASIATEAAEQCERLDVPGISPLMRLDEMLARFPESHPGARLLAAIERAQAALLAPPGDAVLIGPEGGFTPRELDLLRRRPFVHPVSLGRNVLRAETAAIAALARLASAE